MSCGFYPPAGGSLRGLGLFFFLLIIYSFTAVLGFHCCLGFFPVAASGGCSQLRGVGLSSAGFSCCGAWDLGTRIHSAGGLNGCSSRPPERRLSVCL